MNECKSINGWSWNGTCVMDCPIGYTKYSNSEDITCEITKNTSYVRKVGKYVNLTILLSLKTYEVNTKTNVFI